MEIGKVSQGTSSLERAAVNNGETAEGFAEVLELLLSTELIPLQTGQQVPEDMGPVQQEGSAEPLVITLDTLQEMPAYPSMSDAADSEVLPNLQDSAHLNVGADSLVDSAEMPLLIKSQGDIPLYAKGLSVESTPNYPQGLTQADVAVGEKLSAMTQTAQERVVVQQTLASASDRGQTAQSATQATIQTINTAMNQPVEQPQLVSTMASLSQKNPLNNAAGVSDPVGMSVPPDQAKAQVVAGVTPVIQQQGQFEQYFTGNQMSGDEGMNKVEPTVKKDEQTPVEFASVRQDSIQNTKGGEPTLRAVTVPDTPLTQLPNRLAEMVRAMMVQQNPGSTTIRMKLQPEHLGEVTVNLTWSKGELTAHFVTATGLAKEALESAFPQLKQLLAQQDIRLSEAAVFMEQQTQQWDQGARKNHADWPYKGARKVRDGYAFNVQSLEASQVDTIRSAAPGVNIVV